MSLLMLEGFDWLDNTRTDGMAAIQDQLRRKHGDMGLTAYGNASLVAGRHGGTALNFSTSIYQNFSTATLHAAESETSKGGVVGCAIRTGSTFINNCYPIAIRRLSDWNLNIRLSNVGEVLVMRAGSTLVESTGYVLRPYSWYYIEVKFICKNSPDGEIHLHINGVPIGSGSWTGLDTYNGSASFTGWDNILFSNISSDGNMYIDDIYVCNLSGSQNNDFLGDVIVRTRVPNGDASVAFTKSGGATNYENVDNAPYDADWEDTSYVEASVATTKDLYDYSNLETEDASAAIVGAQIESIVRATSADSVAMKHKVKSGVTEIGKATQNFMWNTYGYIIDIQETDPNTGVAWTPTNFDATQFGLEVA